MNLFIKLFHKCDGNLKYIDGSRFPQTGTTGRGKVWRNYKCNICGKLYTSCGNKLYKINTPFDMPIKINCGGIMN